MTDKTNSVYGKKMKEKRVINHEKLFPVPVMADVLFFNRNCNLGRIVTCGLV